MQEDQPNSGDILTLHLPPSLGLDALRQWQSLLEEQLTSHDHMAVDARATERISTPALQLCLSALKTAHQQGKQLCIAPMSPTFLQACGLLAVQDHMTGEKPL